MDISEMLLWTIVLIAAVIGWLKMLHGDESSGCCAILLMVMMLGVAALTGIVWTAGSLIGWW